MPLGSRTDCGDARFCGVEVAFACDIVDTLQRSLLCGFDFVLAPLVHPRFRRGPDYPGAFTRSDLLLTASQWSGQVVGSTSPWINPDAPQDTALRSQSEAALRQELHWAAHLSLQACILPGAGGPNQARILNQALLTLTGMALWVRVRLGGPEDAWEEWNTLRFACAHSTRLGAVLEVGAQLPSEASLARWSGENVKAIVVPTHAFTTNKRGYPVLPKKHQAFLTSMLKLGVQVVLRGAPRHTPPGGDESDAGLKLPSNPLRPYWEYLSFLFRKGEIAAEQQPAELAYRDFLQSPLQPLQDNLESQTYEVFERDATKYNTYEEAVYCALLDRVPAGSEEGTATVVMVVGAGRGPIVAACLAAAQRAKRAVRMYAVEKNPNAIVTLSHRVETEWQGKVTLVPADMREWQASEPADILVSELLGSFGDNELSPECLDGAMRFLKPGGISIPSSYTSFLHPVTTHKLWTDVAAYRDTEHFETPFVVKFHRFHTLAEPQARCLSAVFTFEHPGQQPPDNRRSISLVFKAAPPGTTVCHGLAGYFDAKLYKDVHLSIRPSTLTPKMFSWFPIYFPIKEPFVVSQGSEIRVDMWRCDGNHKVWYEWSVSCGALRGAIHNPNGRSYAVGL
ncbi:Protein arginine N-methyltransferase 1.5 [Auxenochlorella protothecoides]|uniref:Protein arginine N-methyltransferase n=1 Tax=Auxenochlorella protothecoides TaxID=3075 RepID=A0A087SR29_AUXPR|nr:Protein arginine N-methyltransferase 1.5 [Auxenochlorella protothecoides]KFM28183.1 Protein arginine N-methyltransferase 1.5 [Auxenochlorella protothecoides]RMZ56406.1 hypothetical protein APUTEX25_004629 [Auxenochlorella protothecoides]|eukprot:RMZ56406.1 hypothetical protein APUTEX25_004629 [Auxenochlorella protothecoides]